MTTTPNDGQWSSEQLTGIWDALKDHSGGFASMDDPRDPTNGALFAQIESNIVTQQVLNLTLHRIGSYGDDAASTPIKFSYVRSRQHPDDDWLPWALTQRDG
ncbi:hypothetical protein SB861_47020 [Paraburkholderia sp. SIMBA_049]